MAYCSGVHSVAHRRCFCSARLSGLLTASFHSYVDYWVFRGLAYKNLPDVSGFLDRSKNSFLNAIKLDSCRPDIYYNLANLLHDSDYCSALRYYLKSLHLNSYQPHVWHNLGLLLADNLNYLFAKQCYQVSLLLSPTTAPVWCNYGLCCMGLHLYTAAESAFKLSIECDTNFHESYTNLGTLKVAQRQPESALKFFHNGLSIHPSASSSRFNLSLCYLLMGNYTDGWQLYEERFKTGLVPRECFPSNGPLIESFDEIFKLNKPLLIWAEQGIGDVIQFSRYLLYFLELEIDFIFLCPQSLFNLFDKWFVEKLHVSILPKTRLSSDDSPHIPLLSLPMLVKTSLHTIPSTLPYFVPPEVIPFHLRLPSIAGGLQIGIVWASNPCNSVLYEKKSIPFHSLYSFFDDLMYLDLINLHSLQVGKDALDINEISTSVHFYDWSSSLTDFQDTAYLLSQMDLIISVDTGVAHLSASLNIPTWILLPYDADFRWFLDRSDSPWYPGVVKLFRQAQPSDWSSVISSIQAELQNLTLVDFQSLASHKRINEAT